MSDYRNIRPGSGQANFGEGNRNIGRDHVDRRTDNRQYRQVHNNQGMYAEGNVHYQEGDRYYIQQGQTDSAEGRGIGLLIAAIGGLIALAGFGGWMYVIFSGFSNTGTSFNPMSLQFHGLPVMVVGFVAFAVGGIIAAIGMSMARAAGRRYERERRNRRRRY